MLKIHLMKFSRFPIALQRVLRLGFCYFTFTNETSEVKLIKKWSIYQIISIFVLALFFIFIEIKGHDLFSAFISSSQSGAIQLSISLFILVILGFNYLIVYFQIQKHEDFFQHRFWKKVPVILR
ncbi:hypothetical protein [Gracilibacillus phocaeensis]|uniref:hypothetical protein n=1 Tax=Gracilibacillus phocaeensis TaxID=2042304 RepID=UPI0010300E49|nr:hypothetical protein [Gracilibacillus phocaeensis]